MARNQTVPHPAASNVGRLPACEHSRDGAPGGWVWFEILRCCGLHRWRGHVGTPTPGRPSLRWPILSAGADRSAFPHRPVGGPQRTALLDQPCGDLAPPSCLQCQPRPSSPLDRERAHPGDLAQPQEGCPSSTLGPLPAGPAQGWRRNRAALWALDCLSLVALGLHHVNVETRVLLKQTLITAPSPRIPEITPTTFHSSVDVLTHLHAV